MLETLNLHLNFTGYKLVKINTLEINHNINEHSRLYLSALLDGETKLEPLYGTKQGAQIELDNINKDFPTLFKGMVQTIQIKHLSDVYHVEILAVSNSFLLDVKRKRRSFQDKDLSYKDMISEILNDYEGSDFAYKTEEGSIGAFTMQYEETDWEFLKRMASRFNLGIVPDHLFQTPKFVFGVPEGMNRGKIENYNFYIKKDIAAFMISSKNTNSIITELDAVEFYLQTNEKFMIGDFVAYGEINKLTVKSVTEQMINGVMLYTYILSTDNGLTQDKLYNNKITGLSLKAEVLEAIQDTVKVCLEIDEEQDTGTAWQFPYTTLYTAESNAGWYCMPEKGDTVYIYFPNKEEENAVGVNSIREFGGVDNPDIKIFRTPNGKELKFSPEEILITCVDDSIFIRLDEKNGIEIISSKPINIKTDSNMILNAKKKMNINANDEIVLNCKGSTLKFDSGINVVGATVRIN